MIASVVGTLERLEALEGLDRSHASRGSTKLDRWGSTVVFALCACGPQVTLPGAGTDSSSGSDSSDTGQPMPMPTTMQPTTADGTGTGTGTEDSGSGSETIGVLDGTTTDATTTGPATGDGSTTGPPPGCDGTPEQPEHIWVSNSQESTISKINTATMVEEARYITREDSSGNPSRTSVNFNGDVAVANRSGGITAYAGAIEDCPDPLATSSGAGDVVAYPDGCMLWHAPFAYASQRPVAWTQGTWSDDTCRFEDTQVWTAGANGEAIEVLLLDGETGDLQETVPIPGVPASFFGIYGGAVDSNGDFWGSQLGIGSLVHVSLTDLSVEVYPMPTSGYGMTVDHTGRIWTCSVDAARFDPSTEQWDVFAGVGGAGGCNESSDGILWMANNPAIGVDTMTGAVAQTLDLPEYAHGVAVDFEGNVWAVSFNESAYRIDPATGTLDAIDGLVAPYTYSDMTGFALQNAGP